MTTRSPFFNEAMAAACFFCVRLEKNNNKIGSANSSTIMMPPGGPL